ncbi:hypothetical protein [Brevibacillus sp. DP1.3A]|uniref:hypothetical protein n=1 Tax=Brevibacillus sp. DP1.3A TaxID=2738867 RepID=UPI00156B0149|nr:hypothetical protein [Brevibacillus sp. DP1.3A]UED76092.1 hypothetical protein HP399_006255 [Brevibacillus sp. DP1.3A]
MIVVNPVNFAGRLFMPGESVKGELPLDVIEQLKENGFLTDQPEEVSTENEDSIEQDSPTAKDVPELDYPTAEDFSKLKADEQKALLARLNIEPGPKEENRVEQYKIWLAKREEGADNAEL